MEDLQELVAIFRSRGLLKHIKITGDKKRKLYNGLLKSKYRSENDAIIDLYGNLSARGRFAVLKTDLRKTLLNYLFTLDLSCFSSERVKAHIKVYRNQYLFQLTYMLGAYRLGEYCGKKVLLDSQYLNLIVQQFSVLNEQMRQVGLYGKKKELSEAYQSWLNLEAKYRAEVEMEFLSYSLVEATGSITWPKQLVNRAKEHYELAKKIREKNQSPFIDFHYFNIACKYYECTHQYKAYAKICDEAISVLDKYPFGKGSHLETRFLYNKIEAHLFLKDYKTVERILNQCREIPTSARNWYVLPAYEYLLYTHTLDFTRAGKIVEKVIRREDFQFQPIHRRQRWQLYKLCLDFVNAIDNPKLLRSEYTNIAKLEKEFSLLAKDKTGIYALLLIIHILFLFLKKNYEEIVLRTEVLKIHYYKHIKAISPSLSSIFKLILLIERKNFSYKGVISEARKLKAKYQNQNIVSRELTEGLAILPHDWLFDKALEILKRNEESERIGKR